MDSSLLGAFYLDDDGVCVSIGRFFSMNAAKTFFFLVASGLCNSPLEKTARG